MSKHKHSPTVIAHICPNLCTRSWAPIVSISTAVHSVPQQFARERARTISLQQLTKRTSSQSSSQCGSISLLSACAIVKSFMFSFPRLLPFLIPTGFSSGSSAQLLTNQLTAKMARAVWANLQQLRQQSKCESKASDALQSLYTESWGIFLSVIKQTKLNKTSNC